MSHRSTEGEGVKRPDVETEKVHPDKSIPTTAVEEDRWRVSVEYPDGGWRAWSVVFGVMHFLQEEGRHINELYRPGAQRWRHLDTSMLGGCVNLNLLKMLGSNVTFRYSKYTMRMSSSLVNPLPQCERKAFYVVDPSDSKS